MCLIALLLQLLSCSSGVLHDLSKMMSVICIPGGRVVRVGHSVRIRFHSWPSVRRKEVEHCDGEKRKRRLSLCTWVVCYAQIIGIW